MNEGLVVKKNECTRIMSRLLWLNDQTQTRAVTSSVHLSEFHQQEISGEKKCFPQYLCVKQKKKKKPV